MGSAAHPASGPGLHVGSIDVDLALNHRTLLEAGYASIQALLSRRGYEQDPRQPFIFHRTVVVNGNAIKVEVDLLAGEYEGTGRSHRTQPVHEGRARKARGCDLAFDLYVETEIEGELPEGGRDKARIRVSSVVAFLVMKGMALSDRLKEKDAWDIYFTVTNYPGGWTRLPGKSGLTSVIAWCRKGSGRSLRSSHRPSMWVRNSLPILKISGIRTNAPHGPGTPTSASITYCAPSTQALKPPPKHRGIAQRTLNDIHMSLKTKAAVGGEGSNATHAASPLCFQ